LIKHDVKIFNHSCCFLCTAYVRRYEQLLSSKTVETLRRLSSLFVKQPLFWDFVIEALARESIYITVTVLHINCDWTDQFWNFSALCSMFYVFCSCAQS